MNLVVPIVICAFAIGLFAKKMTPGLWTLMVLVIVATILRFTMKN